jgi:hypothetical protein
MDKKELRLSGLITAFAAVLWVIAGFLMASTDGTLTKTILGLEFGAFLLLPFGFMGLHITQTEEGGLLSLTGMVFSALAMILFSGVTMVAIVNDLTSVLAMSEVSGGFFLIAAILGFFGMTAFGISAFLAKVFPLPAGILLTVGSALAIVSGFLSLPGYASGTGYILAAIGLGIMGISIWTGKV